MTANAKCLGVSKKVQALDPERFILGMGRLFREMGDVTEVGCTAVSSGVLSRNEARKIMKELHDVAIELMDLMAATEAAQ